MLKITFWLALACLFLAPASHAGTIALYVSESGAKQIVVYHLNPDNGELTRTSAIDLPGSPGSLSISPDGRHLHAAIRSVKQVATLKIASITGALSEPSFADAGINAAYVFAEKSGRWVLAASYGEGVVASFPVKEGRVSGEAASRIETGKKAHCIITDSANRYAFVPHVGELNKVEQFRWEPNTGVLSPNDPPRIDGGEGQGPRHMQFHPNGKWAYLVNEQGKSVSLCDYDADKGTLKLRQTVTTVPDEWKTKGSCADIHVSSDGRFVYASNRGHDSLAIFAIDPATGEISPRGQTPTEKTPRSFCIVPGGDKFVVAAGEGAHKLIVYRRDAESGALTPLKTYDCGKGPAWITAIELN